MKKFLILALYATSLIMPLQAMSLLNKKAVINRQKIALRVRSEVLQERMNAKNQQLINQQLCMAIINRDKPKVRDLLNKGADINGKDANGETPLHIAWNLDVHSMIPLLLNLGASVNSTDSSEMTLLHLAAFVGSPKFVRLLLVKGASTHCCDEDGRTPLHHAVRQALTSKRKARALRVVRLLLEAETCFEKVCAADKEGKTILDYCADSPESDLANILMQYNRQNIEKNTASKLSDH